ncbi:MAG TPA: hypothetical protein QF644_04835, partial [Candidatus Poseidoniaceae archaeon]|nr:hypothetical protein [Candidatus Poseidoniaceae archaeon]
DRIGGFNLEDGAEITLQIPDTSKSGSWTFTVWAVDDAGNIFETNQIFNLTSESYSGLQHATKIGSSLNLIIIVIMMFMLFTLIIIKKRDNISLEGFSESPSINPDMMFEESDLSLEELNSKNNQEVEPELLENKEIYTEDQHLDQLIDSENNKTTPNDLDSIQELLDSENNATEAAEVFANDTGVMLAAEGTIQGQTGWYHDREGNLVYWNIDEKGIWTRIDTGMN